MPLPIPALAMGADIIGGVYNAVSQNATNQRNREFTKEMYGRQRSDALADWERQNAYNTPAAQMERFRQAGLNPNLIYNNQTQSPTVRSSSAGNSVAQAPEYKGNAIGTYQDAQLRSVQTNNLKQQQENMLAQNALIQAQTLNTLMAVDQKALSNAFTRQNWETAIQQAQKNLEATQGRAALQWQSLEQKDKAFPQQLTNLGIMGDKMKSEIAKNKAQLPQIAQNIAESIGRTGLIALKQIDQRTRNQMLPDIHQLLIYKKEAARSGNKLLVDQSELNDIKKRWRGMGVSETAISDILKIIIH